MTFYNDCTVFTQVPRTEVYKFSLLLCKILRSMNVHRNRFLVNKINRYNECQFY